MKGFLELSRDLDSSSSLTLFTFHQNFLQNLLVPTITYSFDLSTPLLPQFLKRYLHFTSRIARINSCGHRIHSSCLCSKFVFALFPCPIRFQIAILSVQVRNVILQVWFQNRRSKFRKEGNRAQSRRNSAPYPLNTNAKRNEELDETKAGHDGYLLDPPAVVPTQPCNCIECTGIDGGDMAEEQQMPVLSPHRQVCKCEECARDPVAQQLQRIQQQQQQHQQRQQQRDWVQIKPDQRQQPEQYRLLKFCDCANCVIELQKSRKMQTEQTLKRAQILEEQQRLESQVVPIQRLKPGIDDNHIRREGRDTPNTLHYEADPYAVNHRKMSNRRSKGQCSCSQCRIDITNFRYY